MSHAIVVISDIHFRSADTLPLDGLEELLTTLKSSLRGRRKVLLILAGDIAFSGSESEYMYAEKFIEKIVEELKLCGVTSVDVVSVPGNHDCSFHEKDSVRELLVCNISEGRVEQIDSTIVSHCTKVQSEYSAFERSVTTLHGAIERSPLIKEYQIDLDSIKLRLLCVNSSWMSSLEERQGTISLPLVGLKKLENSCDFTMVVQHHPAHWLKQSDFHAWRAFIRDNCAILVTGHEHVGQTSRITGESGGDFVHIESLPLVPEKVSDYAGVTMLSFDAEGRTLSQVRVDLMGRSEEVTVGLPASKQSPYGKYQLTETFSEYLSDPGGNFSTSAGSLALDDIYVDPDLESGEAGESFESVRLSALLSQEENPVRLLVTGEESSGKTTLLKHLYLSLLRSGKFPVLVDTSIFKRAGSAAIQKVIEREVEKQYVEWRSVLSEQKSSCFLLIDNLERVVTPAGLIPNLMKHAGDSFGNVVVTASADFDFTDLLDRNICAAVAFLESYRLKPFGYERRYELIRKWCMLDGVTSRKELDQRVQRVEGALNSVIGRNIVPAYPLYVLVLLQEIESSHSAALQSSGLAHYYHFLIVKGLEDAGVDHDDHYEIENYLANLAWVLAEQSDKSVSESEFLSFNNNFSEKYQTVNADRRITTLKRAKILCQRDGQIRFFYPYLYHYYIGRFLADNYKNPDAERVIDQNCSRLRDREAAYALLFMIHHSRDPVLVDKVTEALRGCFRGVSRATMGEDVVGIEALVGQSAQLLLDGLNVEESQREHRHDMDRSSELEVEQEARANSGNDEYSLWLREVFTLFRSSEVLGQVLKNFCGYMTRDRKRELISELFDAPMRLFSDILEKVGDSPESLALEIEKSLKRRRLIADDKLRVDMAKRIAFHIMSTVAWSLLHRSAALIGIDKLQDDVDMYALENPCTANKLFAVATRLSRPDSDGFVKVIALAGELRGESRFCYSVLQAMVAHHLHLFHVSDSKLQELCASVGIEFGAVRRTNFVGRKRLALPASNS